MDFSCIIWFAAYGISQLYIYALHVLTSMLYDSPLWWRLSKCNSLLLQRFPVPGKFLTQTYIIICHDITCWERISWSELKKWKSEQKLLPNRSIDYGATHAYTISITQVVVGGWQFFHIYVCGTSRYENNVVVANSESLLHEVSLNGVTGGAITITHTTFVLPCWWPKNEVTPDRLTERTGCWIMKMFTGYEDSFYLNLCSSILVT